MRSALALDRTANRVLVLVVASLAFATSAPAGRCVIASLALAGLRPRELARSLRRLGSRASPERRAVLLAAWIAFGLRSTRSDGR